MFRYLATSLVTALWVGLSPTPLVAQDCIGIVRTCADKTALRELELYDIRLFISARAAV